MGAKDIRNDFGLVCVDDVRIKASIRATRNVLTAKYSSPDQSNPIPVVERMDIT